MAKKSLHTKLDVTERSKLFNEGVLRLSKKYQIGVVPKPFINDQGQIGAQAHLVDLIAQNETTN